MEDINIKKRKLLQTKGFILRMSNTEKKAQIIDAYCRLLQYYCEVKNDISLYDKLGIDVDFAGKYDKRVDSDMQKIIRDVNNNSQALYSFYQKVIDVYKSNDFCSHEYNTFVKINENEMKESVYNFFAYLGEDVLKIYVNMIKRRNIFVSNNPDCAGYALDTIPLDYPCIVVENIPKYLQFYSTLVHEIGHCYQFYLQRNQKNFSSFNPYVEITSLLFEKLFCDYLIKNHVIKDTLYHELEDHVYFLNDISIAKALSKLFIDQKIDSINPYDLSYQLKIPTSEVLKTIVNDCGYIMPNKLDLNLDEFHYSISNIIAIYFHEKLKNFDYHEWQEFKDFICTINYLPMNEIISKYFAFDVIEEKIKRFIKSYRNR